MDTVHQINSYICLISGIALNLLLVWLIWKKTNGEVRHYSWILLQGCIVDSVYLLVASIVQPVSPQVSSEVSSGVILSNDILFLAAQPGVVNVVSVNGGDVLFSVFGIFRSSSRAVNRITFYIWIYAYNFTKFSPLNQFYYRYLVLCRRRRVSWQNLFPSFLLITVLAFIVPIMVSFPDDNAPDSFQRIDDIFHVSANNYSVAFFFPQRSNDLLWVVCVTIALDFIVFKLIIWLAYQIWYALRISLNQITKEKRSKIFNKQINIALLVQVFLPVIVSSIPIIYLAHAIITKSGIVTVCQLMTIPLHWIPVLNPLSTILIIKQYRSLLLCSGKGDQIVFYSNSRGTLPTDDR